MPFHIGAHLGEKPFLRLRATPAYGNTEVEGGTTYRESSASVCIQTVQRVLFVTGIRKMLLQLSETSRRCAVRRSKAMRR